MNLSCLVVESNNLVFSAPFLQPSPLIIQPCTPDRQTQEQSNLFDFHCLHQQGHCCCMGTLNSINDDSKWFRKVTDEVGCIPGYWGELIAKDQPGTINGNRFCNSTSQYSKLKSFFPLDHCGAQGNAKNVLKHFDPFCHQLRVMTTTKTSNWREANILKLQFR